MTPLNVLRRFAYELLRALGSFEAPVGRHPAAITTYPDNAPATLTTSGGRLNQEGNPDEQHGV